MEPPLSHKGDALLQQPLLRQVLAYAHLILQKIFLSLSPSTAVAVLVGGIMLNPIGHGNLGVG
jgi:hypothetical protein